MFVYQKPHALSSSSVNWPLPGKYAEFHQIPIGPENVLVTSEATGGLESICKCFPEPGDAMVMFAEWRELQ